MSGPPFPRPDAGANAIGSFAIGVSPIGDIPAFDVWDTIISQYANSPILTQLITNMASYLDPTASISTFFDNIFNIDTAVGYGLDVWGRILGVTRVLTVQTSRNLGFETQSPTVDPFNQSAFFSGTLLNNNFALSDASFRNLLYAKALSNICNGTIPALNQILLTLFPGRGNCFVVDNGGMSMTYQFNFALSAVEIAIITASGVLPKPVGVALNIVHQ